MLISHKSIQTVERRLKVDSTQLNERIEAAKHAEERRRHEWDGMLRKIRVDGNKRERSKAEFVAKYLRPATIEEYKEFLKGYLEKGGEVTYRKGTFAELQGDRRFGPRYYVATGHIPVFPRVFCGTLAFNVIVPYGIEIPKPKSITTMPYGHCGVFLMEDFSVAYGDVEVYSDISF